MRHHLVVIVLVCAACAPPDHHAEVPPDGGAPVPDAPSEPDAPADTSPPSSTLRIGAPGAAVPLAAWDFGAERVGSASAALALTVQNDTDQVSAAIVVTSAAEFPLDASSSCAANIQLAPGATCSILVRFAPGDVGAVAHALVVDGGVQVGSAALALAGTGVPAPDLDTEPPFMDFEVVEIGTDRDQTFQLRNAGEAVVVQGVAIANVIGAGMSLVSTTCGGALDAGATCEIVARYHPVDFGQASGALTVATDHGPYELGANWTMGHGAQRLDVEVVGTGHVSSSGGAVPDPISCGTGNTGTCTTLFINQNGHVLTQSGGTFLGWEVDASACGAADTCQIDLGTARAGAVRARFAP